MAKTIKQRSSVDLVFLDLNLPRKNGHEVLEFIRSRKEIKRTCVVIYTGSKAPDDERRAVLNGANGYLVKPIGGNEMNAMILRLRDLLVSVSEGTCPPYIVVV